MTIWLTGMGKDLMARSTAIDKHLPLNPPLFHVLVTLGRDTLHGYAILRRFEDEAPGQPALLPGTLYTSIARLLEHGLVEEVEAPSPDDDARRRYYRSTALGRKVAAAEARRLERLIDLARRRRLLASRGAP